MLGVPASVLQNLEQELGKVRDRPQVSEKIAQDFLDNQIKLSNRLNTEWVLFATHAMTVVWPTVSDCARLSMLGLNAAKALPPESL